MNPRRLRLHGFRSYDDLDLVFPEGCIAITGPNGSGKSSLILAPDIALFGARNLGDYLSEDAADTEMFVELEFEHAGELYRVRRGYSARGRGKSATDFEQWVDGEFAFTPSGDWEPLTRESQAATQEAIEEVLGLSRETLHASALLMQGQGGLWTEAPPKDRKRVLTEILNLGSWERLLEACRVDLRARQREKAECDGRIALLEEQGGDEEALKATSMRLRDEVAERIAADKAAQDALTAAAEKVAALERAESAYQHRTSTVLARQAELREKQAIIDRAAMAKIDAVEVQKALDDAGDLAAKLAELEERRAEMDAREAARRELEAERDRLFAESARLSTEANRATAEACAVIAKISAIGEQLAAGDMPTCDRCGQDLHAEARERALESLRVELRDFEARAAELNEQGRPLHERATSMVVPAEPDRAEYETLVHSIQVAREDELRVAGLRRDLAGLEAQIAEATPELTAEVARLSRALVDAQAALSEVAEPEPGALESARAEVLSAKARSDGTASALAEARAALVRAEAALEQAEKIAEQLVTTRDRVSELLGELDLLALAERAYGRDGIPALIVEASAIPQIETEASRILAELGTSYRVELRTQRQKKSGDGLADTLDVVVIGDAGERSYETFSGGERTRINLALRIALARLLAHRRGAESRLLAIDEPEFLDEAGTARLAEVLRGLDQEFDRIVLVSHVPTLRDAFDQTIEVVKENGRSVVAV
jgi:exonuclease SbcC